MNADQTFVFAVHRRLIILAWLCLVSSFSLATPVPPCPADCECSVDGSGVQKATCTDTRWNGVVRSHIYVLALKPLDVNIGCNLPKNLSLLFPQLSSISLRNCSLTTLPSDTFRQLKSLQEVDLSHNSLSHFSTSLFAENPKLRYVNLENNPLDLGHRPLLWSESVWEVNLAHCNLSRLPPNTLVGLPHLRYLSLATNRLETIPENSLPSGLRRLDLSRNSIANVPLSELHRLKGLKEIDVSHNPVNCTCQLMGFQDWVSSEGTVFRNQIRCTLPARYAGYSLVDVPQRRLCDFDDHWLVSNKVQPENSYTSSERFGKVAIDEDDFLYDVEIGRVVGEERVHRHSRRSVVQPAEKVKSGDGTVLEGSGAGEADGVEGSGLGSTDDISAVASLESKNDSSSASSATPINSTESSSSSVPTTEVELSTQSTTASSNDSSSQLTTVLEDSASESTNTSKAISPDAGIFTGQKESQLDELTDVDRETTVLPTTTFDHSISEGGLPTSPDEENNGTNDSATTRISSDETVPIAPVTLPAVTSVSADVPNSAEKVEESATTVRSEMENEVERTTLGKMTATQEVLEKEVRVSHAVGLDAPAAPTRVDGDAETITLAATEKKDGSGANSSGQPMLGQMAKNETVKTATSTPYIIPALLIVAVALVCLAIYFSQHNCRPKSWDGNDTKAGGPATELQDVSLLKAEPRPHDSDLYSKKYEAEGRNPQTEKLTNGDTDYPAEENGSLLTDQQHVPPVKKSTTRVTTNYESLPKTPIIIQKS